MRPHRTADPICRPKRRATSILCAGAGAAIAGAWISGCSVLYDLDTHQCEVTADCVALGGVFADLECVNNICREPEIVGCQTNAECMDEDDGVTPYRCVDTNCVPLLSAECPVILPKGASNDAWRDALRSDNPVILAGTGGVDGTTSFDIVMKNYDLALTEVNEAVGGLRAGAAAPRQLVMLGCSSDLDDAGIDAMMTHVADELHIPGMVTTLDAGSLQHAFDSRLGEGKRPVFFMSAFESDPTLATLQDNGLMWHVGPNFEYVARAYAPLLNRVLTKLAVPAGEARVALVTRSDIRLLQNVSDAITADPAQFGISFNGQSVSANSNAEPAKYVGVTVGGGQASFTTQVQTLVDFLPHVVISAAYGEFADNIIPGIESGWPQAPEAGSDQPRPFYLFSPINFNDPSILNVMNTPAKRERLAGINAASATDTSIYDRYLLDLRAAYGAETEAGYENIYDAVYYLIYSAAASIGQASGGATGELTAGALALGMQRLLQGDPKKVGKMDMPDAMSRLANGTTRIQLIGALGPPDFDPITGTRNAPGTVWCVDDTGFKSDVLRYNLPTPSDPNSAELTGTMPTGCPQL